MSVVQSYARSFILAQATRAFKSSHQLMEQAAKRELSQAGEHALLRQLGQHHDEIAFCRKTLAKAQKTPLDIKEILEALKRFSPKQKTLSSQSEILQKTRPFSTFPKPQDPNPFTAAGQVGLRKPIYSFFESQPAFLPSFQPQNDLATLREQIRQTSELQASIKAFGQKQTKAIQKETKQIRDFLKSPRIYTVSSPVKRLTGVRGPSNVRRTTNAIKQQGQVLDRLMQPNARLSQILPNPVFQEFKRIQKLYNEHGFKEARPLNVHQFTQALKGHGLTLTTAEEQVQNLLSSFTYVDSYLTRLIQQTTSSHDAQKWQEGADYLHRIQGQLRTVADQFKQLSV